MSEGGGSNAMVLMVCCSCLCSAISVGAYMYMQWRVQELTLDVAKSFATMDGGSLVYCDGNTDVCGAAVEVVSDDKRTKTKFTYSGLTRAEAKEISDRTIVPGPAGDLTFKSSGRTVKAVIPTKGPFDF